MAPARVWRVRDRESFILLRQSGRRGRSDGITATWVPSDDGSVRLALAVGRAVGGAVVRNRLRRQLRAAFGSVVGPNSTRALPSGTYLLGAGSAAVSLPFAALRSHVEAALGRAGAR